MQLSLRHLRAYFERANLAAIGPRTNQRVLTKRLDEGAGNGTINRELNALRRRFRLAVDAGLIRRHARIRPLRENNVRRGFVEREQLERIVPGLPAYLRGFVRALYLMGWRKSEIASMTWRQVDFSQGWIRLEPGTTKNGAGREFPLFPELRDVFARAFARRQDAYVFHRGGRPVGDVRKSWYRATEGMEPRPLVHDLRRSAARNMVRAGIPIPAVMALLGWRSERMLRRYCITDAGMLADAGARLSLFLTK